MKKIALGKIIETAVMNKYKNDNDNSVSVLFGGSSKYGSSGGGGGNNDGVTLYNSKLNLGEYYKSFDFNQVARHTTYDVVGKRDYSKIDNLIKRY
ncbi:ORF-85 [Catopsilia pomona nucleopolyhedrovirus]|uniref:ORF-85 n=1 Tax=Catopsilia pomona nucleopolyhedrovirus TaxID=1850906 RepID=A0A172WZG2_9ABAC|nr:ORF-85 [Catopsilia pomona nucleopolyhedrovirus]ANF29733.1 ORF-85 [Catopsilia pomona nucleopolyhedrovirus]